MGRPVMIACSLSIISAWGCSAVLPVQDQTDASKKVVVDAEWSVDHPSEEMLAGLRGGKGVDLPPDVQSGAAPLSASDGVARPRATAMDVKAQGAKVAHHAHRQRLWDVPHEPTVMGVKDEARGRSSRPSPEARGRATRAAKLGDVPHEATVMGVEQPSSADRLKAEDLEPQDLRLKGVARAARGEAIAQLELPDGSIVFLREGQRLQLPSAEPPADVVIERIDDTQVQFQFNGSPQVLTLR